MLWRLDPVKLTGGAPVARVAPNHSAMAHTREAVSLPLNSRRIRTKRFGFAVASKVTTASCVMGDIKTFRT